MTTALKSKLPEEAILSSDQFPVAATVDYQICTNCVMDTSDSMIRFDERGVCDHCNGFYKNIKPNWHTDEKGRTQLQLIVDRIKADGEGKDFDCIMGVSGGADSSYLMYIAKETLGLQPLVFHVDAGWNSQEAVNNIEKLVDGLGLDLYTEVIDWEEMRDLQLAFFRASVPHIDTPQDHAFFATMYNFAFKHRIKYILTGANYSTECVKNPLEWHYHATDLTQLKDIHARFGSRPLTSFPLTSILKHKLYYRYTKGIRVVKPLDYVPYIKADAINFLTERFGWQSYPQKHFESRFTKFYESYWQPVKFGFDKRRVQFSSLILTHQMTRDEALALLASPAYDPETIAQDFEYVATKLGIPVSELQEYLEAPNRNYTDYKSQIGLYRVGTRALQLLNVEKRTMR
jgi:N-acetyl sugar amidotransferase